MTTIIDAATLASHLGNDELATDARLIGIVGLVNGLITEKWLRPVTPVPTSVLLLALNMGERAWGRTPGQREVESLTRTHNGSSRTERYREDGGSVRVGGAGVYITDDELVEVLGWPRQNSGSIATGPGAYRLC